MQQQALTPAEAPLALGFSCRKIASYGSGAQPIPKIVMFATKGYVVRRVS